MEEISQADKKLIVQFRKWFDTKNIEPKILKLRKLMGIPLKGIPLTEEDRAQFGSLIIKPANLPFQEKDEIIMCMRACHIGVRELLEDELPIMSNMYFKQVLTCYVLFDDFLFEDIHAASPFFIRLTSLCEISDVREHLEDFLPVDDDSFDHKLGENLEDVNEYNPVMAGWYIDSQRKKTKLFPIAVGIHPEASQRDIIDFIKKNWAFIKAKQDQYRKPDNKVLHSRTKINETVKKRNKLLLRLHNEGKTTKEIRQLLAAKHHYLDDGHILKIISLEKKKREKK